VQFKGPRGLTVRGGREKGMGEKGGERREKGGRGS